jgi:hypothetical protein
MMQPEKGPHATATDAPDEIRGASPGHTSGMTAVDEKH